jgi:DNA-binding response OmpR family regulator
MIMQPRKVLIVDDNKDLAHAMEVRLRANGYDVLLSEDGNAAIALALNEKPSAILLDLYLRDEDGFAVMARFHLYPELSRLPVIIVSADTSRLTRELVLAAGATCFFEKPVDHLLLLATLSELLH